MWIPFLNWEIIYVLWTIKKSQSFHLLFKNCIFDTCINPFVYDRTLDCTNTRVKVVFFFVRGCLIFHLSSGRFIQFYSFHYSSITNNFFFFFFLRFYIIWVFSIKYKFIKLSRKVMPKHWVTTFIKRCLLHDVALCEWCFINH